MNGATSGHEDNREKVKYWDFFCFLSPFFLLLDWFNVVHYDCPQRAQL